MAIKNKSHSGSKKRFKLTGAKKRLKKIIKQESCHNHRAFGKSKRTKKYQQDNSHLHKSDYKKIKKLLVV